MSWSVSRVGPTDDAAGGAVGELAMAQHMMEPNEKAVLDGLQEVIMAWAKARGYGSLNVNTFGHMNSDGTGDCHLYITCS